MASNRNSNPRKIKGFPLVRSSMDEIFRQYRAARKAAAGKDGDFHFRAPATDAGIKVLKAIAEQTVIEGGRASINWATMTVVIHAGAMSKLSAVTDERYTADLPVTVPVPADATAAQ